MTLEQEAERELADEIENLAEEDSLRDGPKIQPQYEALGIHPDTMTCVAILPEKEAKEYVWSLAQSGIAAVAAKAPVDKTTGRGGDRRQPSIWHVAVKGGLAYNPAAYFASISGGRPETCLSVEKSQHPMTLEQGE